MRLFSKQQWKETGQQLRGGASTWWDEHGDQLVGMGWNEAAAVALALRAGNRKAAKKIMAHNMTREEWELWRDGTTANLKKIAIRRANTRAALEKLGRWTARTIGIALLAALGL